MRQAVKILGYATLLGAAAGAIAVLAVPSLREQAGEAKDRFMGFYRQREDELIAALSSNDEEIAAARKHRAARHRDLDF